MGEGFDINFEKLPFQPPLPSHYASVISSQFIYTVSTFKQLPDWTNKWKTNKGSTITTMRMPSARLCALCGWALLNVIPPPFVMTFERKLVRSLFWGLSALVRAKKCLLRYSEGAKRKEQLETFLLVSLMANGHFWSHKDELDYENGLPVTVDKDTNHFLWKDLLL